jgi:hypothetical protein
MASKRDKITDVPPPAIGWLAALVDELNVSFPPEGEGWTTMAQIAEATGRDHQCIRLLLKRKNAETRKFKAVRTDGKVIITPHYRLTEG